MAEGVDVANHQSDIDWNAAHAGGIEFAYIKVTEGIGYVDPRVDAHLPAARAAGLTTGLYHYARPDTNPPEADAESFAAQAMQRGSTKAGNLPPCLDMEQLAQGVDMVDWTKRFLARVRDLTGYGPAMIYANTSWWNNQLGGGGWLDDQTWAWVAHYGRAAGDPGWKGDRAVMHQYASDGRIPGYGANIDRSVCWVDLASLTSGVLPDPPHGGGGGTAPPWPLGPGQYFGLITGPTESHGGYYSNERGWVQQIQEALQRKGFASTAPGWADGVYEQPTRDSVLAWQRSVGYIQTGNIWPDDWALLLS